MGTAKYENTIQVFPNADGEHYYPIGSKQRYCCYRRTPSPELSENFGPPGFQPCWYDKSDCVANPVKKDVMAFAP